MKRNTILLVSIFLSFQLVGCNNQTNTVTHENDKKTVVWCIGAPANLSEYSQELIDIWQDPLNELLQQKNASYKVKIKAISDNGKNEQISDLKKLKENGKQTDVITIMSNTIDSSGEENWTNAYQEAVDNKLLMNLSTWYKENKLLLDKSLTPYDFDLSKIDGKLYGIASNVPAIDATTFSKKQLDEDHIDYQSLKHNLFDNLDILKNHKAKYNTLPIQSARFDWIYSGLVQILPSNNLIWQKEGGFNAVTRLSEFKKNVEDFFELKEAGLVESTSFETNSKVLVTSAKEINRRRELFTTKANEVIVPNLSGPDLNLTWGDHKSAIASWTQNKSNAKDFLLKLFTDKDIANLIQYGIVDEDYQLDENNLITTNNFKLKTFGYAFTNPKITYSSQYEEPDKIAYSNWFYSQYIDNYPVGFRFDPTNVIDEINATNNIFDDLENQLREKNNIEAKQFIDSFNQSLNQAGMQKIIDEANKQYHIWLKGIN